MRYNKNVDKLTYLEVVVGNSINNCFINRDNYSIFLCIYFDDGKVLRNNRNKKYE